jgi:peptide deformylase
MAKRPIITLPDPILRRVSAPVERIDAEVRKLAEDMLDTMYAAPGVGLAAVQVGVPRRLFVLDTAKEKAPPQPLVLINPEIVSLGAEMACTRGACRPRRARADERPPKVTVRLDREGKTQSWPRRGRWRPPSSTIDHQRQADHRFSLPAQARHGRAQVPQAVQGDRGGGV